MEIQEIKINGVIYVPSEDYNCDDCVFNCDQCNILEDRTIEFTSLCHLFDGHALKVKED